MKVCGKLLGKCSALDTRVWYSAVGLLVVLAVVGLAVSAPERRGLSVLGPE